MSDATVRRNALADPHYSPYCLGCSTMARMRQVERLFWRCESCGTTHDERDALATPSPAALDCKTSGHLYRFDGEWYTCERCPHLSRHADHSAGVAPSPAGGKAE